MPKKIKTAVSLLSALAVALLAYAHIETYWLEIKHIAISDHMVPSEFSGKKIAFIADMHCGDNFSPSRLGSVVTRLNLLKPDIIILGGDYINTSGRFTKSCFDELANLKAPLGKFGILGNHDSEAGRQTVLDSMRNSGIIPLVNENRQIMIDNSSITIAGVDETWYGQPDGNLAMRNASGFTVYVSHDPFYLEKYSHPIAKIMLAGHTHGGQVTLLGLPFANLVHRQNYKYQRGIFRLPDRLVVVTNGIGATVMPFRFFARPQINIITLQKQ